MTGERRGVSHRSKHLCKALMAKGLQKTSSEHPFSAGISDNGLSLMKPRKTRRFLVFCSFVQYAKDV
jgi:hypothetical protein